MNCRRCNINLISRSYAQAQQHHLPDQLLRRNELTMQAGKEHVLLHNNNAGMKV